MIVFGVGLSKTGSTSLASAMPMLGYTTKDRVFDMDGIDAPPSAASDPNARYYFKITPMAKQFPEVDAKYPGAKYVLTVRDVESWLKSCARQFRVPAEPGSPGYQRRMETFGSHVFDEARFRASYHDHVEEIKGHFHGREQDLLVIDVCGGEGWEKLCAFLGEPIPSEPFPRENVTGSRERFFRRIKHLIFGGSHK